MRVFLCVNRGLGLELMKSGQKANKMEHTLLVYTQKTMAIKAFQDSSRKYIRNFIKNSVKEGGRGRFQVMLFLMDIPYKNLTYVSGEEPDPYTTEYDPSMETIHLFPVKKFEYNQILSVESLFFYIDKKKRLRHKRTPALLPLMDRQ